MDDAQKASAQIYCKLTKIVMQSRGRFVGQKADLEGSQMQLNTVQYGSTPLFSKNGMNPHQRPIFTT